jgi:hypothetical protein
MRTKGYLGRLGTRDEMLTGEIFATPREPDSVTPNSSLINQLPALHNK